MKRIQTTLLAAGLALAASVAGAQEVQTYRPAPRGLDVIPRQPIILKNGSPAIIASPDCTGSSRCYDFRVRRPVGPSGPSQVQRCRARYQSYRASDNTFKPYNAPRRQCDL